MIDTHCHLHDKRYEEDCEATIERAREAGITAMLTVGCDLADSGRALALARRHGLRASAGIHPHEAKDAPADLEAAFAEFFGDPRIVAIGETGLDYYYDHSPRDVQARVLRSHIRIARERKLPIIFHHRDAFDDFAEILREEYSTEMRGVVHCFTGDTAQARTLVDEFGLFLGIGGVLTFKTADALREAVAEVGIEAVVLETDAPYLAPVPMRGQRNEPAFVTYTASKLADVLHIARDEVVAITDRNARSLFDFS